MRFFLRWTDDQGSEAVSASEVEVFQPSPQVTVLKVAGLWADETIWTVIHNAEGVRILRADWGIAEGKCRQDGIDALQPDKRLQQAMAADMVKDGGYADPEVVAQWVAMLEEIECRDVKQALPKSRAWLNLPIYRPGDSMGSVRDQLP